MSRLKTEVSPLYYSRVIKLIKSLRAQARIASESFLAAERMNAPLWTQNHDLKQQLFAAQAAARAAETRAVEAERRLTEIREALTP